MTTDCYTGVRVYAWGDLPPGVLDEAAGYASAALGCGLGGEEIADDLLGLYPGLLADVEALTGADGVTLDVVLMPRTLA